MMVGNFLVRIRIPVLFKGIQSILACAAISSRRKHSATSRRAFRTLSPRDICMMDLVKLFLCGTQQHPNAAMVTVVVTTGLYSIDGT